MDSLSIYNKISKLLRVADQSSALKSIDKEDLSDFNIDGLNINKLNYNPEKTSKKSNNYFQEYFDLLADRALSNAEKYNKISQLLDNHKSSIKLDSNNIFNSYRYKNSDYEASLDKEDKVISIISPEQSSYLSDDGKLLQESKNEDFYFKDDINHLEFKCHKNENNNFTGLFKFFDSLFIGELDKYTENVFCPVEKQNIETFEHLGTIYKNKHDFISSGRHNSAGELLKGSIIYRNNNEIKGSWNSSKAIDSQEYELKIQEHIENVEIKPNTFNVKYNSDLDLFISNEPINIEINFNSQEPEEVKANFETKLAFKNNKLIPYGTGTYSCHAHNIKSTLINFENPYRKEFLEDLIYNTNVQNEIYKNSKNLVSERDKREAQYKKNILVITTILTLIGSGIYYAGSKQQSSSLTSIQRTSFNEIDFKKDLNQLCQAIYDKDQNTNSDIYLKDETISTLIKTIIQKYGLKKFHENYSGALQDFYKSKNKLEPTLINYKRFIKVNKNESKTIPAENIDIKDSTVNGAYNRYYIIPLPLSIALGRFSNKLIEKNADRLIRNFKAVLGEKTTKMLINKNMDPELNIELLKEALNKLSDDEIIKIEETVNQLIFRKSQGEMVDIRNKEFRNLIDLKVSHHTLSWNTHTAVLFNTLFLYKTSISGYDVRVMDLIKNTNGNFNPYSNILVMFKN